MNIDEKMKVLDVVVAGTGGQGVIVIADILSRCALESGYDVKTFGDYGMARRGGAVKAYVRIGKKVYSPIVSRRSVDILIGLELVESVRNSIYLKPEGVGIVNIHVAHVPGMKLIEKNNKTEFLKQNFKNIYFIDGYSILADKKLSIRSLNMVLLGATTPYLPMRPEKIKDIINGKFAYPDNELNLRAFECGYTTAIDKFRT
jgi:indolepyruvate ferredoxin oxidoreductase beta subunit